MLRHFVCNFQRLLVLQSNSGVEFATHKNASLLFRRAAFHSRGLSASTQTFEDTIDPLAPTPETEGEYIVPYKSEKEKRSSSHTLIEVLRTRFRLTTADVKKLMNDEIVNRAYRERPLLNTLEKLCLEGVSKRSFMDYPWLVTLDKIRLDQKLEFLHALSARDINHFVAFLRLTVPRLRKLTFAMNKEADIVPTGNRVYYISEKLQMDPYLVTKFLSKRLFILEMPFDMLEQNLQHMIDYNVSPMNILKDLWAFRYTPRSVQLRLERAKRAKKEKIMPWMVRCPEPILQKSLKLSLDELAVLGDKASVVEYVADRLQFSVEETKTIMDKHPKVNRVRVTKIKEVLDFLLDEAGFTRYEIAQVPRILCHGLETTKRRFEELKLHGCRPSSLVILCRSKREYDKFLRAWMQMKTKMYKSNQQTQTTDKEHTPVNEK